jgi:hypothetical protein
MKLPYLIQRLIHTVVDRTKATDRNPLKKRFYKIFVFNLYLLDDHSVIDF